MELMTIKEARNKGILQDGDVFDLTNVICSEKKRKISLFFSETGVKETQLVKAENLQWVYVWNSTTTDYVLIGMPNCKLKLSLRGRTGFINGPEIFDKTVNTLYGNNQFGIYGRQITEADYFGIIEEGYEFEFKNEILTSTQYIHSTFDENKLRRYSKYGFMTINHNKLELTNPNPKDCLYRSIFTVNKEGKLVFNKSEKIISTQLFPILYGKINDLLIDVTDLSQRQKVWTVYLPEENVESD